MSWRMPPERNSRAYGNTCFLEPLLPPLETELPRIRKYPWEGAVKRGIPAASLPDPFTVRIRPVRFPHKACARSGSVPALLLKFRFRRRRRPALVPGVWRGIHSPKRSLRGACGHLPDAGHTSGTQRGAGNAAPSHLKNDSFRFFEKKTEKLIPRMKRIF